MTLAHPWILLLWITVPLLVWLRFGKHQRPTLLFSDERILKKLPKT